MHHNTMQSMNKDIRRKRYSVHINEKGKRRPDRHSRCRSNGGYNKRQRGYRRKMDRKAMGGMRVRVRSGMTLGYILDESDMPFNRRKHPRLMHPGGERT